MHYENLVTALKEARKAVQVERDDALSQAKREAEGRVGDKEGYKRESREKEERHQRVLADRDQVSLSLSSPCILSNADVTGVFAIAIRIGKCQIPCFGT